MSNELFLLVLASLFAALFTWAFRALPKEQWQILAAVPLTKGGNGEWHGLNLTYYGFFQATSNSLAVAMAFILFGAIGVTTNAIFALTVLLFAVCWTASKLIVWLIERRQHLFTVGGAVFAGTLALPWLIGLLNHSSGDALGGTIPVIPALAVVSVAYAYGEGLGRLACISFGCCYGKSLQELSPRLRRLLSSFSFTFTGAMKKAAYEGRLEGIRIAPVQAMTSVVFISIALVGTYLFLQSWFIGALLTTMIMTQLWRIFSETLRTRSNRTLRRFSPYQMMAIITVAYITIIAVMFSVEQTESTEISAGLATFWNPLVLLFCQLIWVVVFLITGRSSVTGSKLYFYVHQDRVKGHRPSGEIGAQNGSDHMPAGSS